MSMRRSQYLQFFNRLASSRTQYAECVRITRVDGTVFRFTAHDEDLRIMDPDGVIRPYLSANSFSLTSLETSAGLVVSNMDIDGAIDSEAITENDLRNGFFDNANVELFLAFWSNTQLGTLPLRTSWVGEIQMDGPKYKVDLRGIAQRLAQTFVKATSLECRYDFCDANCTLNLASYTQSYNVSSVESRDTFTVTSMSPAFVNNSYQWGLCRFTSGENEGVEMEILRQYGSRIQLFLPLNFPISSSDTVEMVLGCSKTWDRCGDFDNRINFGGEPFLTGNDMLSRYPSATPDETDTDALAEEATAFIEDNGR